MDFFNVFQRELRTSNAIMIVSIVLCTSIIYGMENEGNGDRQQKKQRSKTFNVLPAFNNLDNRQQETKPIIGRSPQPHKLTLGDKKTGKNTSLEELKKFSDLKYEKREKKEESNNEENNGTAEFRPNVYIGKDGKPTVMTENKHAFLNRTQSAYMTHVQPELKRRSKSDNTIKQATKKLMDAVGDLKNGLFKKLDPKIANQLLNDISIAIKDGADVNAIFDKQNNTVLMMFIDRIAMFDGGDDLSVGLRMLSSKIFYDIVEKDKKEQSVTWEHINKHRENLLDFAKKYENDDSSTFRWFYTEINEMTNKPLVEVEDLDGTMVAVPRDVALNIRLKRAALDEKNEKNEDLLRTIKFGLNFPDQRQEAIQRFEGQIAAVKNKMANNPDSGYSEDLETCYKKKELYLTLELQALKLPFALAYFERELRIRKNSKGQKSESIIENRVTNRKSTEFNNQLIALYIQFMDDRIRSQLPEDMQNGWRQLFENAEIAAKIDNNNVLSNFA